MAFALSQGDAEILLKLLKLMYLAPVDEEVVVEPLAALAVVGTVVAAVFPELPYELRHSEEEKLSLLQLRH